MERLKKENFNEENVHDKNMEMLGEEDAEEMVSPGRVRTFYGITAKVVSTIAILMSFFHIYTAIFGVFESIFQRAAHLGFALILVFAIYRPMRDPKNKAATIPVYDWIFMALALICYLYYVSNAIDISSRMNFVIPITGLETVIAVISGLLLIEATRRVIGNALVIIILTFLAYAFWGHHISGALGHREFDITWISEHLFFTTSGVFGTPLGVSATFIFIFILFGKFLEVSGAGKFFIDLSLAGMGKYRGGPAKTAIVASTALGTISGSAVANTVTTGAFTIPMMKKTGYKRNFAGAVEAVSSTGGQILPPIMGASAFIIASYLGIAYMDLAIAAIIPALLYYVCLYVQVDLRAIKTGLRGLEKDKLPNGWVVLRKGFWYLIPLVVIVVMLLFGSSPMKAGIWSIGITIVIALISSYDRINLKKIFTALDLGARASLETAIACAAAGLIVGTISLTGIGLKFSSLILDISGGILFVTLLLTMVTSIVLGMGLPTVAAYIVQVPLTIPALIELGVVPLAAHLFVFYFAALSAITPPVALAAFAASGLAGSDPMKTSLTALRLGLAAFIVPFLFVYGNELLLIGSGLSVTIAVITAIIGIIGIACAVEGWFITKCNSLERIFLFIGSITMVAPGTITDVIGILVLAGVFVWQKYLKKVTALVP